MEPTTAPTKPTPKPKPKPGDKGVEQEEGKVQKGKGQLGSLENPEIYENVPGHVIPILEHEFDDFDNEAEQFLDGETAGGPVHRLPPQAGRLRPAPARRPDDPRQAAVRRRHPRADGRLRRRGRAATRR